MDGPEYPKAAQAAPPTYLVAYEGSPMSEHMVHLACRIGNDTEATVLVLHAIVVPPQLPMTAALLEEDQRAEVVLSRAEAIASRYGVPGRFVVEHTRSVAEAIVETAREVDARIIFWACVIVNAQSTRCCSARRCAMFCSTLPARCRSGICPPRWLIRSWSGIGRVLGTAPERSRGGATGVVR